MLTPDSLIQLCRARLQHFCGEHRDLALPLPFTQAVAQMVTIVQTNLQPRDKIPSRFEHWKKGQAKTSAVSLSAYMDQVILCWTNEQPRLKRLAADDEHEWLLLYDVLWQSAVRVLASYRPDLATHSADDFAQQACIQIRSARYPFDVPFDRWAKSIVANLIKKELARQKRRGGPTLSLDRPSPTPSDQMPLPVSEQIEDEHTENSFDQVLDRELLQQAFRHLAPQRQEVIELEFWEHLDDQAIANRLNTTVQNVWLLRHRALADLRAILLQLQRRSKNADKKPRKPRGA